MEEDLPQGRYRIHYVHNATVNRRDFYRQLSIGMGLEPRATFAALFSSISQHIEDLASQHKLRVVLLLDSTRVSVLDGGAEIPVRRVDPVANAHRSR